MTFYCEELPPGAVQNPHRCCAGRCYDNRRHRDGDEPAYIQYSDNGTIEIQYWYRDDRQHREGDRPAQIKYSESGAMVSERYYRHGIQVKPWWEVFRHELFYDIKRPKKSERAMTMLCYPINMSKKK